MRFYSCADKDVQKIRRFDAGAAAGRHEIRGFGIDVGNIDWRFHVFQNFSFKNRYEDL